MQIPAPICIILLWLMISIFLAIFWTSSSPKLPSPSIHGLDTTLMWVHQPGIHCVSCADETYGHSGKRIDADGFSNIPLFSQGSLRFLPVGENLHLDFCYAGGYSNTWDWVPRYSNLSQRSLFEASSHYFVNMLMGVQYVTGGSDYIQNVTVQYWDDGKQEGPIQEVSFYTWRSVSTSQFTDTIQADYHRFHWVYNETGKSKGKRSATTYNVPILIYSYEGIMPFRQSFSYLFVPASLSIVHPIEGCNVIKEGRGTETVPQSKPDSWSTEFALRRMLTKKTEQMMMSTTTTAGKKEEMKRKSESGVNEGEKVTINSGATQYVVHLNDSWTLGTEGLEINNFLIALQGLVNRQGVPRLYFVYPPDWPWTDTASIYSFYANKTYNPSLSFQRLYTFQEVLEVFLLTGVKKKQNLFPFQPRHFIRYNSLQRNMILAAFTLAGVQSSLMVGSVSSKLQTQLEAMNFTLLRDLSVPLTGLSDLEVATWVYDRHWVNVSKDKIVWLGGEMGSIFHPGIADVGVMHGSFFCALNTRPEDTTGEYAMSRKLLSAMDSAYLLLGWHAYSKDEEHTYTSLASETNGTVEGLNTNPNLSFGRYVELPEGYVFQPNQQPLPKLTSQEMEKGIFVALVQTDGLGLGAWTKPGRGDLPYTWEITLPDLHLQPAVLRYFYSEATSNDFFTAALGGPGYMYPKVVPPSYLPHQLQRTANDMKTLHLKSLVIFDASNTTGQYTTMGNTQLPAEIISKYFENIPEATGFLNGYTASYTFQNLTRNPAPGPHSNSSAQQALLSFDYYVDPSRSFNDTVKDIIGLTQFNHKRPYFMAIHVREYSTEQRMAQIMNQVKSAIGDSLYLLSADNFLKLAAEHPTYKTQH